MNLRRTQVSVFFVFFSLLVYEIFWALRLELNSSSGTGNVVPVNIEKIMTAALTKDGITTEPNLLNGTSASTITSNTSTSEMLSSSTYSSSSRKTSRSTSKYAYAYVVGGCDPENMLYRNFLYNILISVRILRDYGSQADIVVFLQMGKKTNATKLPDRDMEILRAMNIRTFYIPPSKHANFFSLMLDKFRILDLTEYERVLYMDSDVMPVANLDYLFHLSAEQNILEENVVYCGVLEPANGGFFMLKPNRTHLKQINDIVRHRQNMAKRMASMPYFDEYHGWGHVIRPPDKWKTLMPGRQGTNWTFWAAFADQGLLYHWTKYVRKRVSIIRAQEFQNFRPKGPNGTVALAEILRNPFHNTSQRVPVNPDERCKRMGRLCSISHNFLHFTGGNKPWFNPFPENLSNETKYNSPINFWYWELLQLNKELNLGVEHQLVVNQTLGGDYEVEGKQGVGRHPSEFFVLHGTFELDTHYEVFS